MEIYQPFAHYREPKMMQDDFIPTLPLPPATTISGMIAYLVDRQAKSRFKIGVIGTHNLKTVHFNRGESGDYWKNCSSIIKKNINSHFSYGENSAFFKDCQAGNRILNFEVLQDVSLTIFISADDSYEYALIKRALERPTKYLSLGRKEDFFMPVKKGSIIEEVQIKEVEILNKRQAIHEGLCLKNTYMPVELTIKDRNMEMENRLQNGVLFTLPRTYKDFEAEKKDRKFVYGHYVYVDENGYYPSNGKVQVYSEDGLKEPVVFEWL